MLSFSGSSTCSTKDLSIHLTKILSAVKEGQQKYCETGYSRSGINHMWILKNSKDLLDNLKSRSFSQVSSIKTFDFSTLYTTLPHDKLKTRLKETIHKAFSHIWLWDDKNIRSKKIPDTVLELNPIDHEIDGIYWVKVFLNRFNDDKTRRWKFNRGKLFSAYIGLALDINITNTAGGAEVGCTLNKKGLNQEWSLNSKERIMFAIKGVQSGKALNVASDLGIVIWTCSGTDN
jgi:hypothetical protein